MQEKASANPDAAACLPHGRILAVVLATSAVLASTVAADLLQKTGWRVRVPYVQQLLANR